MVHFFPLLIHSEIYFMNFSNSMKKTFSYLVYNMANNIVKGKTNKQSSFPPPIRLLFSFYTAPIMLLFSSCMSPIILLFSSDHAPTFLLHCSDHAPIFLLHCSDHPPFLLPWCFHFPPTLLPSSSYPPPIILLPSSYPPPTQRGTEKDKNSEGLQPPKQCQCILNLCCAFFIL